MITGDDPHSNERQSLQTRLLDAVKQCQVRFGGRTELATDSDSRVSCLCSAWETVLLHGLKGSPKALAALKQVTEMTGLNKVTGMFIEKPLEKEIAFWYYVKEFLTKHEVERFMNLKNINTDSGRGRAWLRAALNEHSLERYMHMLIESDVLLGQYYESWAFLRDQEKNSMMPMMARGLDSILFAIGIDNADLNTVRQPSSVISTSNVAAVPGKFDEDPRPVIAGESPPEKKKEKKKRKKVTHIVSFDDGDSGQFSRMERSDSVRSYGSPSSLSNVSPSEDSVLEKSRLENSSSEMLSGMELSASVQGASRDASLASGRSGNFSDSHPRNGSFSSADFDLSVDTSASVLVPITAIDDETESTGEDSISRSYDSSGISAYGSEDIHAATFALQQAQMSFNNRHRTQGDGGNVSEEIKSDRMSTEELKKAVVSMMLRKDEVEEQNKSLQTNLEQEMETSSVLRAEIEQMKHTSTVRQEKEQAKLQALQKENELLKHQLRKYVNAVQMLRTEGAQVDVNLGIHMEEPQPAIPPEKEIQDYSHEAEEYEKKLIQVAEMHGELMEFNELLHRQLNAKETLLKRLQGELIDLRGPLPNDMGFAEDSLATGMERMPVEDVEFYKSLTLHSGNLINVWIPSAFLRGSRSDTHHVYQVYVRIRDEEWNTYKRYKEFDDLHQKMKKAYPLSAKFEFPPKKSFGKKNNKVVESRRKLLQTYLRCLINLILETNQILSRNVCKQTLIEVIPFFSDKTAEGKKKQKKKGEGQRSPVSSSPRQAAPLPEQYSGL